MEYYIEREAKFMIEFGWQQKLRIYLAKRWRNVSGKGAQDAQQLTRWRIVRYIPLAGA